MTPQFTLPRQARIPSRREITYVQKAGRKIHTKHFIICYQTTPSPTSRIAVTVSKKVDKRAVHRNRIKRLLKETFRLFQGNLNEPLDVVIIARKNALECSFDDCATEIASALHQKKLLRETSEVVPNRPEA
ncbi:MAG: ribonuclease P protein component [Bdellovibrionota bacterium]|jgi:ribonuclease P protein component